MSGVDNRIVTLQFNNREFETNARTSLSTLQKLKEGMNFGTLASGSMKAIGSVGSALGKLGRLTPFSGLVTQAQKGFGIVGGIIDKVGLKNPFSNASQGASDLQRAAQVAAGPSGMGALEGGVTAVSNKFLALTTIAITALSNITNRAINAGTQWAKSFTVGPILDGLNEYQTTLQSIQTVQANTDRPLPEIEKALKDLNDYSDTTIYNFGEMAKNVGTFTAAGVNLKDSVASIKGIANVAALSGSNSQQAAGAMYQLSQAIAAGKVGAQDWNSVVNAGMAGKKLQTALAQTAVAMGVLDKSAVKTNKSTGALMVNTMSFKNSIMSQPGQESWLSSDVLVNTLASLDGRFSVAYQKAQLLENGTRKFTDAQIASNMAEARANFEKKNGVKLSDQQYKDLRRMADAAIASAQDVKTLGQVFDIAKETIGSGWSASFKSIFGNLKQSKKLFTGMSNGLGDIIRQNALARNELLAAWQKGGGRGLLIDGLKDAWKAFYSVIQAVGKGFRDIFPRKTPAGLIAMTKSFADFMKSLIPGEKTLSRIRRIAAGVFAVLGVGKQILGGIVTGFKTMFKSVGGGNGDFLEFFATIGDGLVAFNNFLKQSGLLTAFFQGLGKILAVPLQILSGVAKIITGIFGGFDSAAASKVGDAVGNVGERFSGLAAVAERLKGWLTNIGDIFGNLGQIIGKALVGIGDKLAGLFTADTFGQTLDVINTTLLGGILLLIKNFMSEGVSLDLTGGLFDGIKETLGSATDAFGAMQAKLKADILMKLAIAIGVMAASLMVLSMIDPNALKTALLAMSGGFAVLIGAMATLLKVLGPVGLAQLYVVSSAVTKMSFSILLLAFAMKQMAGIKMGDMVRGLLGLGTALFIMQKAILPLAAGSKGMAKASASLILIAIGMNFMAVALKIMATMSWQEIGKGLVTLTGALLGIAAALRLMPKGIVLQAAGITILSVAINALGLALKVFATMKWQEIGKGLIVLAGSLALIGLTMRLMPKTMLITAAGLAVVAGAMVVLAGALKIMGGMGWIEIAKGMVVLAGGMTILAVGLNAIGLMGAVGAAGLLIAAEALVLFAPVMLALGAMKWSSILKALAALTGIFVVLGVAGYALAPVVPVIIGLGAALLLMGAGLALAGAGALAAATAFGIVVAAGSAGIQILAGLLKTIIAAIPPALKAFGEGVVGFAVAIGQGAPAVAAAFGKILLGLLDQAIAAVPKMGQLFLRLITMAAKVVGQGAPRLYAAGLSLILGFLRAINSKIGAIVDTVASIIVKFLNALGRNSGKIVQAGVDLILDLMRGVTKAVKNNSKEFGEAGADLGIAIVEGVIKGIGGAGGRIKDKLVSIAKDAWKAAGDFLGIGGPSRLFEKTIGAGIPKGVVKGVEGGRRDVIAEVEALGTVAMRTMRDAMDGVNSALALDPNMSPTVTPVLDLANLTREANKMSSILAVSPIQAGVSFQTAADISAMTAPPPEGGDGGPEGTGGDQYAELNLHLHSPKPIDSVEAYRAGKTLIGLTKEALG